MIEKPQIIYRTSSTPYSPTCSKIMDLFIEYPNLYFTPMTIALSLELPPDTVKNSMPLLLKNCYLTKEGGIGTNNYSITKENMEFWVTDFRKYVLMLQKIKDEKEELRLQNLPIQTSEDNE